MVKNGQFLFAMKNIQDIAKVGFKPPNDEHLAVEAMSIADLQSRAPVGHFRKLQRADFYRLIGVENGQTSLMVDFSTYTAQARRWHEASVGRACGVAVGRCRRIHQAPGEAGRVRLRRSRARLPRLVRQHRPQSLRRPGPRRADLSPQGDQDQPVNERCPRVAGLFFSGVAVRENGESAP